MLFSLLCVMELSLQATTAEAKGEGFDPVLVLSVGCGI